MSSFTESIVEEAALAWLESAGGQVRTFYRRGIIETWGRGTLKIARLMQESGHEPPTVSLREGAVIMTFTLPGKTPVERQGNARETLRKTPTEIVIE